jgi:hypothetical protein
VAGARGRRELYRSITCQRNCFAEIVATSNRTCGGIGNSTYLIAVMMNLQPPLIFRSVIKIGKDEAISSLFQAKYRIASVGPMDDLHINTNSIFKDCSKQIS